MRLIGEAGARCDFSQIAAREDHRARPLDASMQMICMRGQPHVPGESARQLKRETVRHLHRAYCTARGLAYAAANRGRRIRRGRPSKPPQLRNTRRTCIRSPDAANIPTVSPPVVITWDPVTRSHPTLGTRGPAKVFRYQVFAEQRKTDPLKYSLDLPPTMTQYTVAPELIAVGDKQYKFEIQVREVNGNQTAVENCFNVR